MSQEDLYNDIYADEFQEFLESSLNPSSTATSSSTIARNAFTFSKVDEEDEGVSFEIDDDEFPLVADGNSAAAPSINDGASTKAANSSSNATITEAPSNATTTAAAATATSSSTPNLSYSAQIAAQFSSYSQTPSQERGRYTGNLSAGAASFQPHTSRFGSSNAQRGPRGPGGIFGKKPSEMGEVGKMFVGGLSWDTTEETLLAHFEKFGKVTALTIPRDPTTQTSRGFAFLTFEDPAVVDAVLSAKEEGGHVVDGKVIDPKPSLPPNASRSGTPGSSGQGNAAVNGNAGATGGAPPGYVRYFVGGLAHGTTAASMKEFFGGLGKVIDATVMLDKETGRSKGFGFVTFEDTATSSDPSNLVQDGDNASGDGGGKSGGVLEGKLGKCGLILDGKEIEIRPAQARSGPSSHSQTRNLVAKARESRDGAPDASRLGMGALPGMGMGGMGGIAGMGGMGAGMGAGAMNAMGGMGGMGMGGFNPFAAMAAGAVNPSMMNPMMMQMMRAAGAGGTPGASGMSATGGMNNVAANAATTPGGAMNPMMMNPMMAMMAAGMGMGMVPGMGMGANGMAGNAMSAMSANTMGGGMQGMGGGAGAGVGSMGAGMTMGGAGGMGMNLGMMQQLMGMGGMGGGMRMPGAMGSGGIGRAGGTGAAAAGGAPGGGGGVGPTRTRTGGVIKRGGGGGFHPYSR